MAEMVDSKQTMLEPQDIIGIAAMNLDSPFDYNQVVNAIGEELNMEETLYLREGNTLFILHKVAPGKAFFRALNADTANNFLQNSMTFIVACNKLGFDTVASLFNDPVIVGVFRYIANRPPLENMGYRLVLTSSTLNGSNLSLTINNIGYAKILFEKKVYIVLRNSLNVEFKRLLPLDIRTLEKGVNTVNITVPNDVPSNSYLLLLQISDKNVGLENRSEYCIQFANTGLWESTTGYNNLLQTVIYV